MLTIIRRSFVTLLVLLLLVIVAAYFALRLSLPQLTGTLPLPSLSAPATLARDALGQAVIRAASKEDAARALGVAHAQDRFFQMDLQRRVAAGELAEWLGSAALGQDKSARFHQFRKRAAQILSTLPEYQQALLKAYAEGVNKGLSEMTIVPPEYLLTGFSPRPWQPEDSILVVFSMYMDLQNGQIDHDLARTGVVQHFGEDMLAFLSQPSRYQAALDGSELPVGQLPIPPLPITTANTSYNELPPDDVGSNNWAVTGALTKGMGAMLANDMHLSLRVPIIWYRTQLNYVHAQKPVSVTGVSLPGMPGVVVGTNGNIAWGFTNSNIDNVDWVKLDDSSKQWTEVESIKVADKHEQLSLTLSDYGPVRMIDNAPYALSWVAHTDYAVNLALTQLDLAKNVDEALDIAKQAGMPLQNLMVVDADGNAAWTLMGALIPRTEASDVAVSSTQMVQIGTYNDEQRPVVKNPTSGRLWTANARVVGVDDLPRYGDGGYALGARGQQIRDRLMERDVFDEQDFYRIQLDNEARFLAPWQQRLSEHLATLSDPSLDADKIAISQWQQCACPSSVGYTLVKAFRTEVVNGMLAPVLGHLASLEYPTRSLLRNAEGPVWQLLNEQPDEWLPEGASSWSAWLTEQYFAAKQKLHAKHGPTLDDLAWGKVNQLQVKHPLSRFVPVIGEALNMPVADGFGDTYMPSVQSNQFGASQRLFVRPGALDSAILTLPGGQSGHPLSAFYRAGFMDYATQQSTPLLPGEPLYQLTLIPD